MFPRHLSVISHIGLVSMCRRSNGLITMICMHLDCQWLVVVIHWRDLKLRFAGFHIGLNDAIYFPALNFGTLLYCNGFEALRSNLVPLW